MNDPFPDEVDEALWDEACRRAEAVREFLKHRPGKMTAADVALLATEIETSRATAYRLIKLFRAGGTVMSLVDRKRGRPEGHRVLDDKREETIRTTINRSLMPRQPSHDAGTSSRQLPVILAPHADELLSSWISRHASFYAIPPLGMLRHCLPEVSSLRSADRNLTATQGTRLAGIFSTEPATLRRMTFSNVAPASRRLIAARPLQSCSACHPSDHEPGPTLRSQLLGWRMTCPLCGGLLRHPGRHDRPSPFGRYHGTALIGERLLDDEAERGVRTWTSPTEIARLLLMRRVPRPIPPGYEPWRFRVLGAIIPDLDDVVATERRSLPTPANPILPLHLRPALLAGVAIVERAGPEMLKMLRAKMMGQNQARFSSAIDEIMNHTCRSVASSQLQLI